MSLNRHGHVATTTAGDVYENYTQAPADFYIDGRDNPIVSIMPDNHGGYVLEDSDGQVIFVDADELMWLTNPERGDWEQ